MTTLKYFLPSFLPSLERSIRILYIYKCICDTFEVETDFFGGVNVSTS